MRITLTDADCSELARTLASFFEQQVSVEVAPPQLQLEQLFPEERRYISAAVPKRQAEFATARVCARRALARLGVAPCSLLPGADRAPSWPDGIVGSIAHTQRVCAVAVAHRGQLSGVGIDVEDSRPLEPDLEYLVCTAAEIRWLDRRGEERGRWAKLIFSAKEAFYKYQYPKSQLVLDFRDVELDIDTNTQSLRAEIANSVVGANEGLRGARGHGAWQQGLVLSAFSSG
ncbi:MAG: 4'-phosphopantetheinyl transferase superfamily protein [Polyangiaceae bacterium]